MNVITKLLTDESALVKTDTARLVKALVYIIKTYYGLDPDTGKYDDVIEASVQKILIKFPMLTFNQLNECYFNAEIDKRQGTSLTITELIAPLNDFSLKANFIKKKAKEILEAEIEEKKHQDTIREKYLEARQLYLDSIGLGYYKGDMFQASYIVENFKDILDNATKLQLYNVAKKEYDDAILEAQKDNHNNIPTVPTGTGYYENGKPRPNCHYFLSLKIINYFLEKKTIDGVGWRFLEK